MSDSRSVLETANAIAVAISRRDVAAIEKLLAPGFVLRSPGGEARDARTFLSGIADIPGEILFVKLTDVGVDVFAGGALVTGIQHARLRLDGRQVDDRRSFVDWFVQLDGGWKIRAAVDLPAPLE